MMAGRRERPRGRRKDRDEDSIDGSASTATEGPANALPAYVPPPTPPGRTRLGDLLVSEGSISSERLADALLQQATSGERLGSVLVAAGALTESSLTSALARQLGLPEADLGSETPHPDAVALLPADLARASAVVPLRIDADGALVVAAADPTPETLSRVATAAGREVRAFLAPASAVMRATNQVYRTLDGIDAHVNAFSATQTARTTVTTSATPVRRTWLWWSSR